MSLFCLVGHVQLLCPACAQCALRVQPLSCYELCDECSDYMHSDWFHYLVLTSPLQILKWPYLPYLQGAEMKYVLPSSPERLPSHPHVGKRKRREQMYKNRDEERTDFLEWKTPHRLFQTNAYLYLFALHYMNYRVALVSWQEMPMGCEYGGMRKPLFKLFSPSLNEMLFLFIIVAFYMFL